MSSSKPPISAEVKVPCIDCGRECPDGLRYCLYCGGKTLEIDKPLMPMNPHCAECGEVDELSITFCVACGARLLYAYDGTGPTPIVSPGAGASSASGASGAVRSFGASGTPGAAAASAAGKGKFKRNTGFNWTTEITAPSGGGRDASKVPPVPQLGDVPKIYGSSAHQQTSAAAMPVLPALPALPALLPLSVGIVGGLIIVGALYSVGFLPDLFDRVTWPKSGLVVYCPVFDASSVPGSTSSSGAAGADEAAGVNGATGINGATATNGVTGANGANEANGTTGANGANGPSKATQTSASDSSGNPKTASGSSDASSDTSGDSSGDSGKDSGTVAVSPSDDNKGGSSGTDDDGKPTGSGSGSENSNSGVVTSDSANSSKGSGRTENSGSWQLSLENLTNHQLTISPMSPPRSLLGRRVPGCLILKNLAAGNYMLRIQRAGSATTFGMVTLVADKPTVIGYPGGMKLPI